MSYFYECNPFSWEKIIVKQREGFWEKMFLFEVRLFLCERMFVLRLCFVCTYYFLSNVFFILLFSYPCLRKCSWTCLVFKYRFIFLFMNRFNGSCVMCLCSCTVCTCSYTVCTCSYTVCTCLCTCSYRCSHAHVLIYF